MSTKLGIIIADFTTSLATAISVGGTTATLQSATDDDGVALPSGRYFFTLNGSNSSKEHISADLVSTALTNIKSVSRQGVETTGVLRGARIGTTVALTDFAHIKFINDLVAGTTTFNASVPLGYDGAPTISTGNQLATKTYVDGVAVAGAPNADTTTKGIVEEATQAEVDAKTATGGTGAKLFQNLSTQRSTLLSDYVVDTGAADAYVITPVPAITAYTTGQIFTFKAVNANTTTSTINVSGLGTKTIKKIDGATNLAAGDIVAGQMVEVEYDGTNFQMMSPVGVAPATAASVLTALGIGGNGIDGTVVISGNTSLSRDMYYDNLTVNTGITLNSNGFRIFVKGTLTTTGTGKIASNGNVGATGGTGSSGGGAGGTGGTGGAATYTTGNLPIPLAGKTGGTGGSASGGNYQPGGNGTAGTDQTKSLGDTNAVAGGNGGEGGGGNGGDGGAAGAKTGTLFAQPQAFHPAYNLYDVVSGTVTVHGVAPSSGSGGGGTSHVTNDGAGGGGGGSGSSGGVVWISAKTITTLNVEAIGGNGGQGGNGFEVSKGGVGGGGGAGNGGTIVLIYGSGTGITTSVLGGTGGAIGASGVQTNATAGANGNVGKVYTIALS